MRNFFSSSKPSSPSVSSTSSPMRSPSPMTPRRQTFSASLMDENIVYAESIITKWDTDASAYSKISSLFTQDRREAKQYLKSVKDLQSAMHFLVTEDSSSEKLVSSQKLMQVAMKRLELEFYQILSANRNFLDAESVSNRSSRESARSSVSDIEEDTSDDEFQFANTSITSEVDRASDIVMEDLKSIADCMIASGYGKECVKIYKVIRKSIVDESLYNLGVEKLTSTQVNKMDWESIELKIKSWLHAIKVSIKTLFYGERILCDSVFSSSDRIRESIFTQISKDGALTLFSFPELVVKTKKSMEKMFRTLDMYDSISELWPEIESIFSFESTSIVRSQAVTSLVKLGEAIRLMLSDFEAAIQKDSSKTIVPGGGVHPLSRYVMNYIVFLTDYSGILSDILADYPLSVQSPMPQSYFASPIPGDTQASPISERLAWLILVLLCKLDAKASFYKEVSLSYLFLANNLNYVVSKVSSSNLKLLLGDEWLINHECKVTQYAANYERMSWSIVMLSLPEDPYANLSLEAVKDCFRRFNSGFEEVYKKQTSWVVPNPKLRDEIKVSLAKMLVTPYRDFYARYRGTFRAEFGVDSIIRYAPEDLDNYLSDLFYGTGTASSYSGSALSLSSSPSPSRVRGSY